jgi:hypothetical protein
MLFTTAVLGDRISNENLTTPGMVFVEPGRAAIIPVDASAECFVATRCE